MGKICLTCKVNKKFNKKEVPEWYKELGNDSLLPSILNDKDNYKIKNLKNFKTVTPKITDLEVAVDIDDESEKWIFYWASNPQEDYSLIEGPKKAYDNEENHGLIQLDKEGKAKIILNCPQPYKVNKITYPRHVHYTVENNGKWDTNIRTYIITCHIDYDKLQTIMKDKSHIILNALDEDNFNEFHIPNSFNLHYASFDKLNKSRRMIKIKKLIKNVIKNYPDLDKLLKDKKLNILDVPIVTYCANNKCSASEKLLEYLNESKFNNVLEYPGGIKDFKDKSKSKKVISKKSVSKTETIVTKGKTNVNTVSDKNLENSDITDNIYNLDIENETLVYEDIVYIHNIYNEEIYDTDNNLVGLWDGSKIKWETDAEKYKHEKRIENKDTDKDKKGVKDKKDLDKKDLDEKDLDEDEDEDNLDEDEDVDEDEDEDDEDSKEYKGKKPVKEGKIRKLEKLDELKNILSQKPKKSIESKKVFKFYDGIKVKDRNYVSSEKYENQFKGWGFTFF